MPDPAFDTNLDAVIKESLRIRPIMPGGAGRRLQQSVEIGGYTIPAGTALLSGMYLLHRRPDLYPDPESFQPDRAPEPGGRPPRVLPRARRWASRDGHGLAALREGRLTPI
ncbi:MAG: cytochrome family [Acidobacteriota bacterium]|jgi:cytochrome P450